MWTANTTATTTSAVKFAAQLKVQGCFFFFVVGFFKVFVDKAL